MKHILYDHFGLGANPWPPHCATADARRVSLAIAGALADGSLVAITGERGIGKTHAVWQALDGTQCTLIEPLRLDKENLHIGDIQRAIVTALSDESPRHSGEARAGQVRRLLRGARQPLLLIDEAHCLHHQTLRAIKRLRELGARGRQGKVLPVILLGQCDPTAQVAEVALRTDVLPLTGISRADAGMVLKSALGAVAEPAAIEQIVARDEARNWLELQRLAEQCLGAAMTAGETRLTVAHVAQATGEALNGRGMSGHTNSMSTQTNNAPRPGQVAAALNGGKQRLVG